MTLLKVFGSNKVERENLIEKYEEYDDEKI